MTFYNKVSGKVMHNYLHTINNRGNPDTIILDPLVTYRMTIQTTPPVKVDSFKITPGKHNIIATDTPQGYLTLKTEGGMQYRDLICIVRETGKLNTLTYHQMYKTEKYIIGKYDLEIPILPRIYLNNIEIKQSSTTAIQVPQPGLVTFVMSAPGFGSLYVREQGKDLRWIYNLNKDVRSEIVVLQPGSYTAIFRPGGAKSTLYSVSKNFDVTPGGSKAIELY
jgi:Ca-activated chloride channel family protein